MTPHAPVTRMHLLLLDVQKRERSVTATVVSVTLHGAVVIMVLLNGDRVVNSVRGLIEETVQYLYPAPRDIGRLRPGERVEATGAGRRAVGTALPSAGIGTAMGETSTRRPQNGIEWAPIHLDGESVEPGLGDNAYSVVDVDSTAVIEPTSAAPSYPSILLLRKVEGGASLRFVVDSTGLIDMATVQVIAATHALFAQAVIEAMPKMKYRPARFGSRPVRVMVEQTFSFKIERVKGDIA